MYAAAGGASLASRQARQRQRQKQLQQSKSQKELKPHQPKQYHNYTDDAISIAPPKLSRVERGTLRPPVSQSTAAERRHSAAHYHLKEAAPPTKNRIKESPSICIPVTSKAAAATTTLENSLSTASLQFPQYVLGAPPPPLERRCSFVRQVEEKERCPEGGLLDKCNHYCNFEVKQGIWEQEMIMMEKDAYGSLEYPFSECSQGRAAWQERERGRRCSLSEEARQHRIKQSEAHHRWMKRNRIHDSTYGTGSDDDDFFSVYHQSAAANALLYVGLGATAIGSVIFFVGTGEKGFKTLELRMIGPTLIACGLLCCLIRVLLCACPSNCRRRKKTRLKNDGCPHSSNRYSGHDNIDSAALLSKQHHKKKVSIVPSSHPIPSTSTQEFSPPPKITLPSSHSNPQQSLSKDSTSASLIEMQNLELVYDIQSVSSNSDEDETIIEATKLTRVREPANRTTSTNDDVETCLSVVIETNSEQEGVEKQTHSGIVLSPLQLKQ